MTMLQYTKKGKEAPNLFRSVVGQLINPIEPFIIRSLITLQQSASES